MELAAAHSASLDSPDPGAPETQLADDVMSLAKLMGFVSLRAKWRVWL
jgi:hypothetical protein